MNPPSFGPDPARVDASDARPLLVVMVTLATALALAGCDRNKTSEEGNTSDSSRPVAASPTEVPEAALSPLEGLSNERFQQPIADELERFSPEKDGSLTEQFSEEATDQLKSLTSLLHNLHNLDSDLLEPLLADSFRSTSLMGTLPQAAALEIGGVVVQRAVPPPPDQPPRFQFEGAEGFLQALKEAVPDAASLHSKFKIITVNSRPNGIFFTRVQVQWQSDVPGGALGRQQNAAWNVSWIRPDDSSPPRLRTIQLVEFEEVAAEGDHRLVFTDCTESALAPSGEAWQQVSHGVDYWRERIDWRFGTELIGPHGLAVGDVNGDGRDDVFLCTPGGLPNRLLVQQADGTVRDEASEWEVDFIEASASALVVDLDNDGDQDLAFTSTRYLLIFENVGGKFARRINLTSNSVGRSLSAADYDLDGDLDLYVCGYYSRTGDPIGIGRPMPYHDANNGAANYLVENQGGWKFAVVTEEAGLDHNNRRFSYAAAWEDFDGDGDPDLYVANDFGRNNLYRNDRQQDGKVRFTDIAAAARVEDISAGMSVTWGDYNGDGHPDLYIGNMFSSAGNRVAYQREFRTGSSGAILNQFRRHARGNTLFRNAGDGTFQDVTLAAKVNMGRWAWSSTFADINNDGWEDLLVANGMVTGRTDPGDL